MKNIEIVKKLYPFNYSIAGKGNNKAIKEFLSYLPFKIYSFKSQSEINGWRIPKSFEVIKANLIQNGKLIYDGKLSPLGVPINSSSFNGKVSFNTLKKHIYYGFFHKD